MDENVGSKGLHRTTVLLGFRPVEAVFEFLLVVDRHDRNGSWFATDNRVVPGGCSFSCARARLVSNLDVVVVASVFDRGLGLVLARVSLCLRGSLADLSFRGGSRWGVLDQCR